MKKLFVVFLFVMALVGTGAQVGAMVAERTYEDKVNSVLNLEDELDVALEERETALEGLETELSELVDLIRNDTEEIEDRTEQVETIKDSIGKWKRGKK